MISEKAVLLGEKHRTWARIAMSFELHADLPRAVLHYLPPRRAPSASRPLSHSVHHRRRPDCRQPARGCAAS